MGRSSASGRAARRLLAVTLTVSALWLLWSSPAFAQSLISLPAGGDGAAGDTTTGVLQAAAPVVQAVASTAEQATTPVTQTTTPVVQQTVSPVAASTAPTVHGATQAAAPLVETATRVVAPVVQAAAPVVQEAITPVLEAATPLVQATAPILDPLLESAGPVLDATSPVISATATGTVSTSAGSGAAPTTTGSSSHDAAPLTTSDATPVEAPASALHSAGAADRRRGTRPDHQVAHPVTPFVAGITGAYTPLSADSPRSSSKGTRATAPPSRWPGLPDSPTTPGLAATAVSGGASFFVAALAVALLVTAPGLSRRLRLRLAPRPLSIPLPSLERPG